MRHPFAIGRYSLRLSALLFLGGCIVVEDFGGFWDKGSPNPCVNTILETSFREDGNPVADISAIARSLHLGPHTFIMLRDNIKDPGGSLLRYRVENGDYITYRLNDAKRDEFLAEYPGSPVVLTGETATIGRLDKEAAQLVEEVAGKDKYWIETSREPYNPQNRADCPAH